MNEFDNNLTNNENDPIVSDTTESAKEPKEAAPSNQFTPASPTFETHEPPKVEEQFRQYRPAPAQPGSSYNHGSSIAYTPSTATTKEQPKRKGASVGVLIAIACATVVISCIFSFASALIACLIATNDINTTTQQTTVSPDSPLVIYKDSSEIQSSVEPGEDLSYSAVAALVKNSVVEITTEYNVKSTWYNYVTKGAGSGVIISEDGYIVTNAHVITGDTSTIADNIIVRLNDGTEFVAGVVGYDTDSDIAILKIEASGLTYAVCGNSDNLAVGEELVVVGNPLGELGGTVTNGIVSATERQISVNGVPMTLIQTNAAVSPGNSGGGMFNMQGQLVGIINAKSSGNGVEGLGFAIPINEALGVTEQLMEYGYVRGKIYIGVEFEEISSSNSFMFFYGLKPGVYVTGLVDGYNEKVLRSGDRVVAIDGKTVSTYEEVKTLITSCSVGDVLKFQVERDGKLIEVDVTCYEKVPENTNKVQFE